jgi:hypothetical protein
MEFDLFSVQLYERSGFAEHHEVTPRMQKVERSAVNKFGERMCDPLRVSNGNGRVENLHGSTFQIARRGFASSPTFVRLTESVPQNPPKSRKTAKVAANSLREPCHVTMQLQRPLETLTTLARRMTLKICALAAALVLVVVSAAWGLLAARKSVRFALNEFVELPMIDTGTPAGTANLELSAAMGELQNFIGFQDHQHRLIAPTFPAIGQMVPRCPTIRPSDSPWSRVIADGYRPLDDGHHERPAG